MSKTIYLDTETTGLNPALDDVLEIAIIDDDGNVLMDTLCAPVLNSSWEDAQDVHGITPEMVEDCPTLVSIMPAVVEILSQGDELVIYNSPFDLGFLCRAATKAGIDIPTITHHCAMRSFAEARGEWNHSYGNYKWHRLAAAAYVNHKWTGEVHRALADAQACRSVWHWLRDRKQKREAAKSLTHADLASIDLDTVLESLEESAAERGVDDYLSNLTWFQRENLQSTLNKCLIDWLNTNVTRN